MKTTKPNGIGVLIEECQRATKSNEDTPRVPKALQVCYSINESIKGETLKTQKYQINTDFIFSEPDDDGAYTTHGTMEGEVFDTLEEAQAEYKEYVANADEGDMIDLVLIDVDEEDGWYDVVDYIECIGPVGYPDDINIK